MAKQSINTLKAWFETQDTPTQNQFWDWLDSYRHLDDKITIDDLEATLKAAIENIPDASNNQIVLPAGTPSWNAPAGTMVLRVLLIDPANPVGVSIGTVQYTDDYYIPTDMTIGYLIAAGEKYFPVAGTLWFNNITPTTIIKITKE